MKGSIAPISNGLQFPKAAAATTIPEIVIVATGMIQRFGCLRRSRRWSSQRPDEPPLAYDSKNEKTVQEHDTGFQAHPVS